MQFRSRLVFALATGALLAGCSQKGELVVDEGVGIAAIRSQCPSVGIADYTGDVTTFRAPGATDTANMDVSAALTNVRMKCDQDGVKLDTRQAEVRPGELVHATVSFDVLARRTDGTGARDLNLPFFITVLRGSNAVIAKRIGTVAIHFAPGELRATGHAEGLALIDKNEATLSRDIRDRITKKRVAGEADAAVDPLAQSDVQDAIARATFEVLVGFQLSDEQLTYNATR
ncbi:MAG TPA: hypothetical protein VFF98_13185 [Novosphingobium sp.]|nr:hypothetical protein [Novosphingobium sp.]